jgi:hypothetical protein
MMNSSAWREILRKKRKRGEGGVRGSYIGRVALGEGVGFGASASGGQGQRREREGLCLEVDGDPDMWVPHVSRVRGLSGIPFRDDAVLGCGLDPVLGRIGPQRPFILFLFLFLFSFLFSDLIHNPFCKFHSNQSNKFLSYSNIQGNVLNQ